MMVMNITRGTLLGEDIPFAKTFVDKANGLSGAEKPSALFFKTRWGIHTFGMKFNIDCVILDNALKVRATIENLKPRRFFFWNPSFKNVLELPAGTVSMTGTKIGDVLEFKL
jgi:uncharacterized membrane protein (UPF0127 family)